jgi:hypothetical protein
MKSDSSKILLIAGVLLFAIGTILLPEASYVFGWYNGCTENASSAVASGSCFFNRWPGITAGGSEGTSAVQVEIALLSIFVMAGFIIALFGAYRRGLNKSSTLLTQAGHQTIK